MIFELLWYFTSTIGATQAITTKVSMDILESFQNADEEISAKINWIDYLAIGIYFAMIIIVGIVVRNEHTKECN